MDTVPLAFTLKIGTPEESDTENKSPVRSSVIENNCPCVPCMSKTVDPETVLVATKEVALSVEKVGESFVRTF